MKTAMRIVVLICVMTLAWTFLPLSSTASFTSQDMGTYILWSQDSTQTYFQQYKSDYSWKDSTNSSTGFNYMGTLADMSALLFDGSFHSFTDNNYSYQFWASGTGVWQNASLNINQYAYDYTSGQWWNQGNWGGWATLGTNGLSTAFMGAGGGVEQSLGNNWSYLFDGTYGIWQNANMNNVNQYAYNYITGNWYDQGNWGGWTSLGSSALSASFMGDGASHTLGANWSYLFDGNYGYWNNGSINQYAYNYTTGNWYDQGNWGGWASLGSSTISASFMGDGASHWLSANWSYLFDGAYGYWENGNLNNLKQFAYNYASGSWYNQGTWGGWMALGSLPAGSAAFRGDGSVYDIGRMGAVDWTYRFDGTYGYWHNVGMNLDQFAYDYNAGNWYDQGKYGGWASIGYAHSGVSFLGDGVLHNSSTIPIGYQYDGTVGWGKFWNNNFGGFWMYAYDYNTGEWFDQGQGSVGGWQPLGLSQMSAWFMGDGNVHTLDANWSYQLVPGVGGLWTNIASALTMFKYQYANSQWLDQGQYGGWQPLGSAGASAAFMGDGALHSLDTFWSYQYGPGTGNWWNTSLGLCQFAYNYLTGQWSDQGAYGGWQPLGPAILSAAFLGDGNLHSIGASWNYTYVEGSGYWHNVPLNLNQFAYEYGTGQWSDQGTYGGWQTLGNGSLSAAFMGDGHLHNLDLNWRYTYVGESGYWYNVPLNLNQFAYDYGTGQWFDQGRYGGWGTLGNGSLSAAFIGDGAYHDLGLHDGYAYEFSSGHAYYASGWIGNWTNKFDYNYSTGQWKYNISGWYNLGNSGMHCQFANIGMGDVGLRWSFDSSIDPASFGFNASNTIDAYIKYDSSAHGSPDRILYYDDAGHRVAEATIQAGSKGTRIAVDTSYVGASTTWDYYYSWWDSSTPYSPLVIVYDNSGNQLFKQISVEHIYQVGGSLGLWDGQAWIWEDANGNGQYDSNWSASGDRILHWRQQKGGTCGIYTDMNITESVLGNGSTQTVFPTTYADDTIRWFSDHYWQNPPSPLDDYNTHFNPPYNPSTMDLHDSIYNNYGGIYGADGQDYLTQRQGFLNPQTFYAGWQGSTFTLTDLVNRVESGKLCHVDLRAEDLWARYFASTDIYGHAADANHDGYLDAGYVTTGNPGALDHGVWVRGFQRDTNGNVTYVILEDSGTFRGAFARVPVEHFLRAWGRPTSQGVYNWAYFTDPPSGRTWSTAGINTWMFNPAVWSTSW